MKRTILNKIVLPISFSTDIIIIISNGSISLSKEKISITKETISSEFTIFSSLYEDGIKSGIPLKILTDAIRLYSFDIDFQRDIQKNTKFSISYEMLFNDEKKKYYLWRYTIYQSETPKIIPWNISNLKLTMDFLIISINREKMLKNQY